MCGAGTPARCRMLTSGYGKRNPEAHLRVCGQTRDLGNGLGGIAIVRRRPVGSSGG